MKLSVRTLLFAVFLACCANAAFAGSSVCDALPEDLADGGFKIAFVPDSTTAWQPAGGEVRFTLKGDGIPATDMQIQICFRWQGLNAKQPWILAATPRIVETGPKFLTLAVQVPSGIERSRPNWFNEFNERRTLTYTGFGLVPLADMHVVATSTSGDWKRLDVVQPVGITIRWLSLLPAILSVVVAWMLFASWGRDRGIRSGAILSVISGPNGVASLSQFQIMLWTFLFGGGIMYVMALSGSMIDVPSTALGLLGISGAATLGAQLSTAGSASPAPSNPPGATTNLNVRGTPSHSSVMLSWSKSAGGDPAAAFAVQVRPAGTLPWSTAAHTVVAPPFAVTGLTPNTAYEFQVFAVNDAGSGPASIPVQATTAITESAPAPAPAAVSGLIARPGPRPEVSATLSWSTSAPPPEFHVVQYRRAGAWTWSTATGTAASPFVVTGLSGSADYEFQVFAINAGISGMPSDIASVRTAMRRPQWSDLVANGDGDGQIDVTRTQMLLFTVIAAAFVALTLFDQSRIPEIPTGILTLMGLSNGVYLAAKFVPGGK